MTRKEANRILIGYVKACNEDDFVALERFSYEEVMEAMRIGAEALSRPSLPSNIDEAAEKYSENILANNEDLQDAIEDAFKAGAEWMAEQGYTKEETVYFESHCDENRIMVNLGWGEPEKGGFNPGDKVIVQIRKVK